MENRAQDSSRTRVHTTANSRDKGRGTLDASDAAAGRLHLVPKPAHVGLMLLGLLLFAVATTAILQTSAVASTSAMGGINVEPAARPWQYVGANPDSWWCPMASQCTTSNPTGRIDTEMALA